MQRLEEIPAFCLPQNRGGAASKFRTDCDICPVRTECIGKCRTKHIERNYFWKEIRADIDKLETLPYQRALRKRQIWSEGTFAAQKWGNNLARLFRRGIEAAEDHCLLSATALNLKRMIRASF